MADMDVNLLFALGVPRNGIFWLQVSMLEEFPDRHEWGGSEVLHQLYTINGIRHIRYF